MDSVSTLDATTHVLLNGRKAGNCGARRKNWGGGQSLPSFDQAVPNCRALPDPQQCRNSAGADGACDAFHGAGRGMRISRSCRPRCAGADQFASENQVLFSSAGPDVVRSQTHTAHGAHRTPLARARVLTPWQRQITTRLLWDRRCSRIAASL